MINSFEDFTEYSASVKEKSLNKPEINILVSLGTCGIAAGTLPVQEEFISQIKERELSSKVELTDVGCMGICYCEPSIELINRKTGKSIIYGNVKRDDVSLILDCLTEKDVKGVDVIKKSWYYPETEDATAGLLQAKIALRNTGRINPEILEEYIFNSGYQALAKVLSSMTPKSIIQEVLQSGLRGRGGGGFPTGKKWDFAAAQKNETKFVICNADEGDPGAFMDRAVLEGDPHSVLEAMAIAGFAIGSHKGFIYIRAEYPLAIKRLQIAIKQSTEFGLLGKNIMGFGFDFEIELRYGAGAFVCGEETALIHSIEGLRGMPTTRPPFPAVAGLWEKPTIVNNVETFANVCAIIRKGAQWYKSIGTETSAGTKVFALAGKINKVGLIEVPMGTNLRDIIYDVGGGIFDGKEFKAVQTGGPSGGCITKDYLDTPIDYETLKSLGSMMGSGGMIVMDEDDCMVNVAKFFLDFTVDESCGKCTPCRIGGKHMYAILDKITKGRASDKDLETLRELCQTVKSSSLCGLGMTCPNPVLSTMKYFENEYREHVADKKCKAHKCPDLITYLIDIGKCIGCSVCAKKCPVQCISGKLKEPHKIDQSKCIKCGECFMACKFAAISRN
ncbi:MAG TPA: NADH-quinone oxidoreductase subunit F [Lentisphaeria bacterium]|nr:NADH-quinone oxidoreductase subunit F [Lentisphaeria bacterium]